MSAPEEARENFEKATAAGPEADKDKELQAELDRVFDYHKPEGHIVNIHEAWRTATKLFATNLMTLPATRERAMALTRLEECAFWIHACVARNHDKISAVTDEAIDEIIAVADGKNDVDTPDKAD